MKITKLISTLVVIETLLMEFFRVCNIEITKMKCLEWAFVIVVVFLLNNKIKIKFIIKKRKINFRN